MKSILLAIGVIVTVIGGVLLAVGAAQAVGFALLVVGLICVTPSIGSGAGAASSD